MRKTLGILLAVMLMVTLAACGGSKNEPAGSQGASPSGSASSSPSGEAGGNSNLKAYEGTTVNVLMKTGYTAQAVTDYKADFEQATGIKLNIEVVDEPTARKKFILDNTTKTGAYDVMATEFWYMPEFLKLGGLEPLDDYIAGKKSEWLATDDMPQGLKDTYKGDDGKMYSLPVTASGGVLMYRKDLFDKYGIAKPVTTADVLAAAKTLKAKLPADVVPFVGRGESSSASFGSTAGWAWAYGASVLDANGNVTVNSDAMKQGVGDWVTLMKDYGTKDAAAMGWDTMSEVFRQGKAAMNFDMSGFPSVYDNPKNSQVAGKMDTAIITGPGNHAAQWMFGEGLGISANSKNKDAAWLFVQWRTSLQVAEKEAENKIRVDFPLDSVYKSPKYTEATKDQPFAKQVQDVMKSIDTTYWPHVAEFDKLGQAFQQEISLAIAGKQDVAKALDNAQAKIKDLLKK